MSESRGFSPSLQHHRNKVDLTSGYQSISWLIFKKDPQRLTPKHSTDPPLSAVVWDNDFLNITLDHSSHNAVQSIKFDVPSKILPLCRSTFQTTFLQCGGREYTVTADHCRRIRLLVALIKWDEKISFDIFKVK